LLVTLHNVHWNSCPFILQNRKVLGLLFEIDQLWSVQYLILVLLFAAIFIKIIHFLFIQVFVVKSYIPNLSLKTFWCLFTPNVKTTFRSLQILADRLLHFYLSIDIHTNIYWNLFLLNRKFKKIRLILFKFILSVNSLIQIGVSFEVYEHSAIFVQSDLKFPIQTVLARLEHHSFMAI